MPEQVANSGCGAVLCYMLNINIACSNCRQLHTVQTVQHPLDAGQRHPESDRADHHHATIIGPWGTLQRNALGFLGRQPQSPPISLQQVRSHRNRAREASATVRA